MLGKAFHALLSYYFGPECAIPALAAASVAAAVAAEERAEMTGIHTAIQEMVKGDEELGDSVLVGWVIVAEWLDGSGDRRLSRTSGDGADHRLAAWTRKGYLQEALDGRW